jgi:hypothetical protein
MATGDDELVVVPETLGPVVAMTAVGARRAPDDVDDLIDELFGASDARGPGAADAVLLGSGVLVTGLALALAWPTWLVVAGILTALLGAILPVRALWHRVVSGRVAARRRALAATGTVLSVADADVARMVETHDRLARRDGGERDQRAARIAHDALVEVAVLLDGRLVPLPEERGYVTARSEALDRLEAALDEAVRSARGDDAARARIEALDEVDRIGGTSSIAAAGELAGELRRGVGG